LQVESPVGPVESERSVSWASVVERMLAAAASMLWVSGLAKVGVAD
jgi:hypothetical protein